MNYSVFIGFLSGYAGPGECADRTSKGVTVNVFTGLHD
jgi:hypothetical protein